MKEQLANLIASRAKNGDRIGCGSGSTAELAMIALGKRVREEGLSICGLPTSKRTEQLLIENGISVVSALDNQELSFAFDGADEVDPKLGLLKGNGAAMFSEKVVAKKAGGLIILVTEDKLVPSLGTKFALPIEVFPEALRLVERELLELGVTEISLRQAQRKYGPVVSDHGNLILDCRFKEITPGLEKEIKSITGVVESGLFFGLTKEVLVAKDSGTVDILKP